MESSSSITTVSKTKKRRRESIIIHQNEVQKEFDSETNFKAFEIKVIEAFKIPRDVKFTIRTLASNIILEEDTFAQILEKENIFLLHRSDKSNCYRVKRSFNLNLDPKFMIQSTMDATPTPDLRDKAAEVYYELDSAICEAIDNSIQYTRFNHESGKSREIKIKLDTQVKNIFR
jgi:hypothetical protein